jgi:hypothetical protein
MIFYTNIFHRLACILRNRKNLENEKFEENKSQPTIAIIDAPTINTSTEDKNNKERF